MNQTAFCILIALTLPLHANARPVSYPEGWTVMQRNASDFSSLHVHYSPTFQDSIGLYTERNWDGDWHYTGLQYNRLVKRWNNKASQANVYFKTSVGAVKPFEGETQLGGFVEVSADWETRRWFTEYRLRARDVGVDQDIIHIARLGVAPYIGDYGDLHTWLMVDIEHHPEDNENLLATPIVRFFYGVQLVEVGYTPATERFTANLIVRF